MFSQYTSSTHYFQLLHHIQSLHHLYCQCLLSTCSDYVLSEYHIYCPCPVSTLPVVPMSKQNTTSTARVQSEYHLFCSFIVSTPPALPMSSQNTICSVHLTPKASQYSIFPAHVSMRHPCLLPMFSQNTTSPTHEKSWWSSLQPLPNQHPFSTAHVQSLPHTQHISSQNYNSTTHANLQGESLRMYGTPISTLLSNSNTLELFISHIWGVMRLFW